MIHALCQADAGDIPVIVGGAIPQEDISYLKDKGVCEVLTTGTPTQTILNVFRMVANEYRQKKHTYE
jgi:methylmalonyl-CoA mutase C-terminal domain/subunit